jgi:ribosomal protein L40E
MNQSFNAPVGQVAGNNIVNYGDGFVADPNNPDLTSCRICHYHGLALGAHECPKCGHNYLAEHMAEQARREAQAKKDAGDLVNLITIAAFVFLAMTSSLMEYFNLSFPKAAGWSVLGTGFVWYVWVMVNARMKQFFDS